MHYSPQEKFEIIKLVENSDLGVIRTLRELKVNKTTFYKWYHQYNEKGYEGLKRRKGSNQAVWNKINEAGRDKVVEIALERPALLSKELAQNKRSSFQSAYHTVEADAKNISFVLSVPFRRH